MKFIFPLFASCLLAIQTLYAQAPCGTPPPPAASFCQSACVYCELDGQTGNNSAGFGNQVGYCNGLVQNNAVWYAFIAGSTSISFSIETSNCTNGDGLQAAIWSACSDPEPIQCNIGAAGTGGATIDITYSSFTPGATYYLMIDGWIFDVCDYVIHVVDGSTFPQVPPAPDAPQGPSQVCNGGSIVYSIPPVENAGYYHWTAPVGSSINGLGNNVIIDQAEQGNEVTVTFSSAGGQVCVAVGNACVPQSNYACTAVSNAPYLLTQLPPLTLSFDQTPYTWPVDETVIYTAPGVYLASATLITDFGCDSIVRQLITIEQPVTSTVKGIVFWDDDQDGVLDPGEQPYRDGAVVTLSSGSFINSDANGGFEFSSTATIDTLRAVAPFPGINVRPLFRVKQAGQTDGYNFGLSPRPTGNDLSVHLNTSVVKPGELSVITVIAKNGGPSAVQQAMVQAKIPLDQLQLIQIEPAGANVSINGNQLSWTIDVLNPDQQTDVRLLVEAPGSANLGNIYNMEASIGPTTSDRY
ncbi:MAG: hypothetical protein JNJ57_04475, partial [Saprospiraceae bacterium]|nr:hypothetical protein [Saprospiraceae bacterium]